MYLLANGLEHAKTACFSSYKTDWLHDNWVMRRQNGFLHSLHFFATGRLIALLFWQLGRLRTIKKKALLDFLRWLARQKTHKTQFAVKAILFLFEKSLLWLPTKLDLVRAFEYNAQVWWTVQNMSHNANIQCPKKKRLHRSLSGWKKAQWVRVCVSVCV